MSLEFGAVDFGTASDTEAFDGECYKQYASRLGLLPGLAVDLSETKPDATASWDLGSKDGLEELSRFIEYEMPELVTASPARPSFAEGGLQKTSEEAQRKSTAYLHASVDFLPQAALRRTTFSS